MSQIVCTQKVYIRDLSIRHLSNTDQININNFPIYLNGDPPRTSPFLNVNNSEGLCELVIDKISPRDGEELKIGPLTLTGLETIQIDVNQEKINVGEIGPYLSNNTTLNTDVIVGRTDSSLVGENTIRFASNGFPNTVVLSDKFIDNNFVIFNRKNSSSKIMLDTVSEIDFNFGSELNDWNSGIVGVNKIKFTSTTAEFDVDMRANTLTPLSGVEININNNIIGDNSMKSATITTDTITTDSSSINIHNTMMGNSHITTTNIAVDNISANLDPNVKITNLQVLGTLSASTFSLSTITVTNIEGNVGDTVNIEGMSIVADVCSVPTLNVRTISHSGGIIDVLGLNITTDTINIDNINCSTTITTPFISNSGNELSIEGVLIEDGKITCDELICNDISSGVFKRYADFGVLVEVLEGLVGELYMVANTLPDGQVVADGSRVLVMGQTDESKNGLYLVSNVGLTFTRCIDADSIDTLNDCIVYVSGGLLIGKMYAQYESITTIGTDSINFVEISGGGGGGVSFHNTLPDLQGGVGGEYYHLSSSEHSELTNWMSTAVLDVDGSVSIGNVKLADDGLHLNTAKVEEVGGDVNLILPASGSLKIYQGAVLIAEFTTI